MLSGFCNLADSSFLLCILCFLVMLFPGFFRYGSLFKSHILGCPTVVCMDPELNRFILMNEAKGFVPGYPQSMLDILGRSNIAAVHGELHKAMRSAMHGLVSPPMIREQLLPKIDDFMRSYTDNWSGRVIDIQEKTKEVSHRSDSNLLITFQTYNSYLLCSDGVDVCLETNWQH